MFSVLLTFLTLVSSVLSSSFDDVQKSLNLSKLAGRYRSLNPTQNQWEVEELIIHRFDKPGRPNLMAQFYLYRSRIVPPCSIQKDMDRFLLLAMVGETCGYFVPDQPIHCRDGGYGQMAGGTAYWQNPLNTKNYWSTCEIYPRGVEGEQEVPEERKRWLKWRMIDLKEKSLPEPPVSQPAHLREIPFISAKLEVINGVPLKNATTGVVSQVKVYSMILTFGKDGIDFQCTRTNHMDDGLMYSCSIVLDRKNKQLIFDRPALVCSQMANVTETTESLSDFERRFS